MCLHIYKDIYIHIYKIYTHTLDIYTYIPICVYCINIFIYEYVRTHVLFVYVYMCNLYACKPTVYIFYVFYEYTCM